MIFTESVDCLILDFIVFFLLIRNLNKLLRVECDCRIGFKYTFTF